MGSNVTIPCRLSVRMKRGLEQLVASKEGAAVPQDVYQNLANQYLRDPVWLDALEHIELREPVTEFVSVSLSAETAEAFRNIANTRGVTLSALMRVIILHELRQEGIRL